MTRRLVALLGLAVGLGALAVAQTADRAAPVAFAAPPARSSAQLAPVGRAPADPTDDAGARTNPTLRTANDSGDPNTFVDDTSAEHDRRAPTVDDLPADSDHVDVVDVADRCPDDPALFDKDDGCPDPAPQPVVLDSVDRCPDLPEGVTSDVLDSCPE